MANKIQLRRDSAANWSAFNPILADGEIGIDTTNGYMKFGDGVSPWNECMYVRFPGVGPDNLSITGTPPAATVGQGYSFVPTITGGTGPYVVTSIGAPMPAGLVLGSSTGSITGTPSTAANHPGISLRVTDSQGNVATLNLPTLVVSNPVSNPLSISGAPVTSGTVGTAYPGFSATASGGQTPYTYSIASGALPAGLSLSASTGAVSGTPTAAGTVSGIVIRVTDALGATANLTAFAISVSSGIQPLTITGTPGMIATVGEAYSFTPVAAGGVTPRTFALIAGTLPAGLSFNATNGAITGTPSAAGTAAGLSIRVTDNAGTTATLATFSLAVAAPVADSRARFGYGAAGDDPAAILARSAVYGATNGSKAGTFTIGSVPAGQYVWFFIEASASAAGVNVSDALGTGGWQGASYTSGPNSVDTNVSPNTSTVTAALNSVIFRSFRNNYPGGSGAITTA